MARRKCSRPPYKERFKDQLDADLALLRIRSKEEGQHRRRADRPTPTRSYQCEFCRGWHLTSQVKGRGVESRG